MHLCGIFDLAWMVQHGRLFAQDGGLDKISGGSRSEVVAKLADAPNRYRLVLTLTTSRLKRTNLNRLLKTSSFSPISALSAFWPIRICNSAHSAVLSPQQCTIRAHSKAKLSAPTKTARCIILHTREGDLAIPATSNLKRPRALPNRSREDRIRDGPSREWGEKHDL